MGWMLWEGRCGFCEWRGVCVPGVDAERPIYT